MDRRQNRTRKAIFQAVAKLLPQKHFERITVQEIIDEADIGRSTFYAHFETKDELLHSLCDFFFDKIRTQAQAEPLVGDKSFLEIVLIQVLTQGKKYRAIMQGMYASEAGGVCEGYVREELRELFQDYVTDVDPEVPESFAMGHLADGFGAVLRRWIQEECPEEPEEIVKYYLKLTRIQ